MPAISPANTPHSLRVLFVIIVVVVALIAIAAFASANPGERFVQDLQASGMSSSSIDGIKKIWEDNKPELEAAHQSGNREDGKALFEKVKQQTNEFIATVSTADQEIWANFVAEMEKKRQAHQRPNNA